MPEFQQVRLQAMATVLGFVRGFALGWSSVHVRVRLCGMQAVKAHVLNGRFVSDETTDLPEGTQVELQVTKVADPWAEMNAEERAELEASIEEGFADVARGDHMEARAFMAQLRAKNP